MSTHSLVANLSQRSQTLVGWLRRVPPRTWRRTAVALLSLWMVYSLAQIVWVLMPTPALPEPPLTLPQNAAFTTDNNSEGSQGVDINALKSLELFGKPGAVVEEVVEIPDQIDAPETKLSLVLRGVAPSSHEPSAGAIIADGSKQELFFTNDDLTIGPRGVKLSQVMADRVILNNNGNLETLRLYEEGSAARGNRNNRSRTAVRPPTPPRRSPAARAPSAQTAEFVEGLRPDENQLAPTAQQIKSIDDVVGISMYREGGQLIGFRIRPKRNRQIFDELGLQPNDVVTAVNNVGLTDTSQAMELYRSLSQTTQVSLEILRDGVTVNVDINLDDYAN